MSESPDESQLRLLVERIDPGSARRRAWSLTGGVSAQVTVLEIALRDGQTRRIIVRRHGGVDLAQNPEIARDEMTLLRIARSHGIAAPEPIYFDDTREILPTPYIVVEFVEGDTEFAPSDVPDYVQQLATHLARIHRVPDSPELAFLPRLGRGFGERPATLDHSLNEGRIRDALEAAAPVVQPNASVLLHGDYWPGNILWRDGRLVAVVDWEDARVGDPLADLANCRLELLWALGVEAMRQFTVRYRSATTIDVANLPYWDLCAALRPCSKLSEWGLDGETEARMRERHAMFIAQAFDALAGR